MQVKVKNIIIFLFLFSISCSEKKLSHGMYFGSGYFVYCDKSENVIVYDFNERIGDNMKLNHKNIIDFYRHDLNGKDSNLSDDLLIIEFSGKKKAPYMLRRIHLESNTWDSVRICNDIFVCCGINTLFKPCCISITPIEAEKLNCQNDTVFSLVNQLIIGSNQAIKSPHFNLYHSPIFTFYKNGLPISKKFGYDISGNNTCLYTYINKINCTPVDTFEKTIKKINLNKKMYYSKDIFE